MGFVTVAEKLAQKGFRITEHELALARRMETATREITSGVERISPTSRTALLEGYQAFLKAAPEGSSRYDLLRTFTKEARDDFRRDYPTTASADAAFYKVQVALSEEVRRASGLDSKASKVEKVTPTNEPKVAGPYTDLGTADDIEKRAINREARDRGYQAIDRNRETAIKIETAQREADVAIKKGATAWDSIAGTKKGKMNVDTFFGELQAALTTRGLLKNNMAEVNQAIRDEALKTNMPRIKEEVKAVRELRGDAAAEAHERQAIDALPSSTRNELKSPQEIRQLIVDRQPVSVDEIAAARKYFEKWHNDSSIATDTLPDAGKATAKLKGAMSLLDGKKEPSWAQAYEYRTGDRSMVRSALSNPVRTGVNALLLSTALSTVYTTIDYQHPKPLGSLIPGMIMDADDVIGQGDGIKGFAEYILYRYKNPILGGKSQGDADLKTYYDIDTLENLDQAGREEAVRKLRNPPIRIDMTPDVQTALTLYAGERLFNGKVTKNGDELQDALNAWKAKNNEAIDKQKDEHAATEKKFEAKVAENAQGAIEHGVPTTMFTGKSRETAPAYKDADKETNVELADFTNRAKGILYNNPDMQQALSKKFSELAGPDQVMDTKEASEFQKNANEMLTKSGFTAEKANKTVNFLMGRDL